MIADHEPAPTGRVPRQPLVSTKRPRDLMSLDDVRQSDFLHT